MKKKKKVTMQDIANELGISKVTVSKAFNDKYGVGQELKEDILKKAEEMGYRFRKAVIEEDNKPKHIIIFMAHKYFGEGTKVYFYVNMYQRITKELNEIGYIGTLSTVTPDDRGGNLTSLIESRNIDAIMILGNLEDSFLESVRKLTIPKIYVDCMEVSAISDCVLSENIYSTYELTRHLLDQGHHYIGYVGSVLVTQSIADRFLGYQRALLERKIMVRKDWVLEDRDYHNEEIDFELPKEMPTAFVCNCDETAYRFIKALRNHGIKVPEEISIVSFDNDIYAEICDPKLTTVAVDIDGIAKAAVRKVKRRVERKKSTSRGATMINGKIIYRESVHPNRASNLF
ncbi:LacI family DNA-binding transcriptional regulator [Vallitaleaceae bacterium 9-2]